MITCDYAIDLKKGFIPSKEKVYSLSRDKKEKVRKFIQNNLHKEYIRLPKLPQTVLVLFSEKKNGNK